MISVVYPSSANWFFADQAMAIAQELTRAGREASAVGSADLGRAASLDHSLALIVSLGEALGAASGLEAKRAFVSALGRFKRRILVNYDCLFSKWFDDHLVLGYGFFTDIFDVAMTPQDVETAIAGAAYHWVPESFSDAGRQTLTDWSSRRPIPWALAGHATKQRAALIAALIESLAPNGFVFSPPLMAYDGSYGLDRQSLRRVIERSDLYIWGSYHKYPYHEAIRALSAIEAGAVPVKIDPLYAHRMALPWVFRSIDALRAALDSHGAGDLHRRSRDHVLGFGTLGDNLGAALRRAGA